tara:strand:+ start:76 stop:408 length:333 start_codon:yes stop_codon:yes gene_type:complete
MKDKKEGLSYYVWQGTDPVSPSEVIRISGDHQCFITGESIGEFDDAYWTDEFDAWISERGYQMIQNAHNTGELENNPEWELIFGEWYTKDESAAGRFDFYNPDHVDWEEI